MAQIASVAAITGTGKAFAVNEQGISRELKAGDVLQKGETIRTVGDVRVELVMDDGRLLAVAPNQVLRLDENVTESDQRPTAQDSAVGAPAATADTVLQALERGTDLSTELEATAAGLGGGGADGGSSFVQLLRIVEGVDPLAYNYTYTAPELPPDLQANPDVLTSTTMVLTADPVVLEGSPGVTYTVTLGDPAVSDMTVTLSNGAVIVIPAGSTTGSVLVPVQGDDVYKDGETLQASVDTVQGGGFLEITVTDQNVITVVNDTIDTTPVTVGVSVVNGDGDVNNVIEGNQLTFRFSVNAAPQSDLILNVTIGGVAQTVTIAAGSLFTDVTVASRADENYVQGATTVTGTVNSVSLTDNGNFENLSIESASATATIVDDGDVTTASISTSNVTENDAGVTFNISLSNVPQGTATAQVLVGETTYNVAIDANGKGTLFIPTNDPDAYKDPSTITATVTGVTGGNYETVSVAGATATANITDIVGEGDTTSVIVTTADVNENAAGVTFSFALTNPPQAGYPASLTVQIAGEEGTRTVNLDGAGKGTLTIATNNPDVYNDAQTVMATVTAINGGNFEATSVNGASATANVTDINAIDTTTVTLTGPDVVEEGAPVTYTATLLSEAHGQVTVTLSNGATITIADQGLTGSVTVPTTGFVGDVLPTVTIVSATGGNFENLVPEGSVNTDIDSIPTVGVVYTSDPAGVVNEGELPGGNLGGTLTTSGTLPFTTGNDSLAKLEVGGVDVTHGGTVINPNTNGTLVITETNGTYSWTYTLTSTTTDVDKVDETNTFAVKVTDSDGDTASSTLTVTITDDVPSITVSSRDVATDALVVDETLLGTNATANFADNFTSTPTPGADGATVASAYTLGVNTLTPTGLVDTASGQTVVLSVIGGVVHGQVTIDSVATDVFTVSVNASGTVELDQIRAVKQPTGGSSYDEASTPMAANLITLTRTDTITDGDGDTASSSASINIGAAISFEDDGPAISVTLTTPTADALVVDETLLGTNATANFADNFTSTPTPGADGATVASAYTLGVNTLTPTGLVDTASGQTVVLSVIGGVVHGQVTIDSVATDVFTVSVNASGTVELDQIRAVKQPTGGSSYDEASTPMAANLITLTRTDTITDGDGDTASSSASINIGAAISFEDDGPAISVTLTTPTADALVVDETLLGTNATANFADNFTSTPTPGADGATVASAYTLGVNTLTPTGLVDTASGQTVVLSVIGGVVHGQVTIDSVATDVFTVSVNASGTVELDQIRAVKQPTGGSSYDEASTPMAANLITLTRTDTITDGDGDTASSSASINIGAAISFEDDGPAISVTLTTPTADALVVDETLLGTNATANFADNFTSTPTPGADGATVASAYTLGVNTLTPTGLVDTASGQTVVLSVIGGVVHGQVTIDSVATDVFTVSVNASGTVELDQIRAVKQPTGGSSYDEASTPMAANLITLTRTDTITDGDGDTASSSASINIGAAISFEDDGPAISVTLTTPTADALVVDETLLGTNATANFADNFTSTPTPGADGATVASAYTLGVNTLTPTGLVDTASGQTVVLSVIGGVVHGQVTIDSVATDVFTVSVNASGTVELDQIRAVKQPTGGSSYDEASTPMAANLITLTRTDTITDGDGDTASSSASINIGAAISFEDDGPAISVTLTTPTADALVVDETLLGTNATANFADNFTSTPTPGADGATVASAYTLGVNTLTPTGLVDTASGQTVVLSVIGGVVHGQVTIDSVATDVFTVSVNASGTVELDQIRAVKQPTGGSSYDEASTPMAANLITLTRTDTITDGDGDTASSSASINIGAAISFEDDGPAITSVMDAVLSSAVTTSFTGLYDASFGADGLDYMKAALGSGGYVGTTAVTYETDPPSQGVTPVHVMNGTTELFTFYYTTTTYAVSSSGDGSVEFNAFGDPDAPSDTEFFKLTVNSNGTYTFDMISNTILSTSSTTVSGSDFSAFGPTGQVATPDASLVINGSGNINASANGIGVANPQITSGESLLLDFASQQTYVSFALQQWTGGGTVSLKLTISDEGSNDDNITLSIAKPASGNIIVEVVVDANATIPTYTHVNNVYTVHVASEFDDVNLNYLSGTPGFNVNNITYDQTTTTVVQDMTLNFQLAVTDLDGDTAILGNSLTIGMVDPSITVTATGIHNIDPDSGVVLVGNGENDTLIGGGGSDILTGGGGDDTMTGGGGADVFKWSLGETGHDTIKDFNSGSGTFNLAEGDVLDLRDLIQNTSGATNADLSTFLHFAPDTNENLVMSVDPDGAATPGFTPTQTVTLEGVTLAALTLDVGANNEAIIAALRTHLKVGGD